jgi:cytochrome c5
VGAGAPPREVVTPRAIAWPPRAARAIAAALLASAPLVSTLFAAAPLAAHRTGSVAQKPSAKAGTKVDSDPTLSAVVRPAEASEIAALPEGPGKALVAERCLLCHSAGLITQQRKDAAAWGRTVTQMRTWGSPIQDADQTTIVTYLTDNFGTAAKRP